MRKDFMPKLDKQVYLKVYLKFSLCKTINLVINIRKNFSDILPVFLNILVFIFYELNTKSRKNKE